MFSSTSNLSGPLFGASVRRCAGGEAECGESYVELEHVEVQWWCKYVGVCGWLQLAADWLLHLNYYMVLVCAVALAGAGVMAVMGVASGVVPALAVVSYFFVLPVCMVIYVVTFLHGVLFRCGADAYIPSFCGFMTSVQLARLYPCCAKRATAKTWYFLGSIVWFGWAASCARADEEVFAYWLYAVVQAVSEGLLVVELAELWAVEVTGLVTLWLLVVMTSSAMQVGLSVAYGAYLCWQRYERRESTDDPVVEDSSTRTSDFDGDPMEFEKDRSAFNAALSSALGLDMMRMGEVVAEATFTGMGTGPNVASFEVPKILRVHALVGDRLLNLALALRFVRKTGGTVEEYNSLSTSMLTNAALARFFDARLTGVLPVLRTRSEKQKGTVVEALIGIAYQSGVLFAGIEEFMWRELFATLGYQDSEGG